MVFISYIKLSVSVNDYLDLLPYLFLIIHNEFHLYFDAYFDAYLGFDVYIKLFFFVAYDPFINSVSQVFHSFTIHSIVH